jgi:hypothetical protein
MSGSARLVLAQEPRVAMPDEPVAPRGFVSPEPSRSPADGVWTRLTQPGVHEGFQIFDALRNRVILLPLGSGSAPDDQWILDLDHPDRWRRQSAGGTPPTWYAARAAVYDIRLDRILVIARDPRIPWNGLAPLTVWALPLGAGGGWRELAQLENAPLDRRDFSLIFDSKRGQYVLFGGESYPLLRDVWRFDARENEVSWEQLVAGGDSIGGRSVAGAIYDVKRDRMILFGGIKQVGDGVQEGSSDVLALDFSPTPSWKFLPGDDSSLHFSVASACLYDPVGDRMIAFLRYSFGSPIQALALGDLTTWSTFDTTGTEGPALSGTMVAADPTRGRGILVGRPLSIYEVSLSGSRTLRRLDPGDEPLEVEAYFYNLPPTTPAFYDGKSGAAFFPGGLLDRDAADSRLLWRFSADEVPHWSRIELTGETPAARVGAAIAYDSRRDRWLLFGGYVYESKSASGYRNDLWALELSPERRWIQLAPDSPTSGPEPRESAAVAYDALRDRLLVFGGSRNAPLAEDRVLNDTWAFALGSGSNWTSILPAGSLPRRRGGASAVVDPGGNRMLIHGGDWVRTTGALSFNPRVLEDTWALALGAEARWDSIATTAERRYGSSHHFGFFDPARGTMSVIGGLERYDFNDPYWRSPGEELRSLPLSGPPMWARLDASGAAPYRQTVAWAFDAARDRLLVFQGQSYDAWALDRGHPTHLALLDLEPKDATNSVYPGSQDRVTVAILGSATFDAATVDPATATLEGAPARDVSRLHPLSLRDVNRDGCLDRILQFDAARMVVTETTEVVRLDAKTRSGEAVLGYDLVRVRPGSRGEHELAGLLAGDPDVPTDTLYPFTLSCAGPVRGAARLDLSLSRDGNVVLEFFSVSGRRVARRDLGDLLAGPHEVTATETANLRAGVYLARILAGGGSARTKIVVLP